MYRRENRVTTEDALKAMHAIESQCDGSPESIATALELMCELMEGDSENFWQIFFERKSARNSSYRGMATRFISAFGANATFGDPKEFFKRERDAK